MSLKRRRFTAAFKLQLVREVDAGKSVAQVAREHEVHPNLVHQWRALHRERGGGAFDATPPGTEAKVADLERLIGQLTVENHFLKNVLARLEAIRNDS